MSAPKDTLFAVDHLKLGLKERAVKSAGVTFAAQCVKALLHIGSIVILSRLLAPADFGLVAMVVVFTGLAIQLMDGGLSMATIQRESVTHAQVSNLFWINSALGAGLCLFGILVSPLISAVYDEPRLTAIMVVMSTTFLIGGMSVQHDALLRRQMRFKTIAIIDVVSMAAGIFAAIIAALAGLQYWSLVISPVVTFLSQTLMRWLSVRWIPSSISTGSGVRPLLRFGINLTGANCVGYMATNLTPFAVGYLGGSQPLGLFNRANMLTSIPSSQVLPPLMNVLQPTIARVASDPSRLRSTITSIMGKLTLATMLVTLTMAILADWIVLIFLGAGWDGVVPLFRMLAVFSLVEPIAGFLAVSLIAVGNAKALLHWKVITLSILVASLAIGALWGPFGVVAAYALSGVFIRLPGFLFYSSKFLPVTFLEFTKALVPSGLCALVTIVTLYLLRLLIPVESAILGLVVYSFIAVGVYLLFCWMLKPTRRELSEMATLLNVLKSKKVS